MAAVFVPGFLCGLKTVEPVRVFSQGQVASPTPQRDPAVIRQEALRDDLTKEQRTQLFGELKALANDAMGTPSQRCVDAAAALYVFAPIDPSAVATYATELASASWTSGAQPSAQGWLKAMRGYALTQAHQLDNGLAVLQTLSPDELAVKDVYALNAIARLVIFRNKDQSPELVPAIQALQPVPGDTAVRASLRAEAGAQLLSIYIDIGLPDTQLRSFAEQVRPLAAVGGETGDFLRLTIDAVDPIAPDAQGHWPRTLEQIIDDSARDSTAMAARYGVFSRNVAMADSILIGAQMQKSHPDPAEKLAARDDCLRRLDAAQANNKGMMTPERIDLLKVAVHGTLGNPADAIPIYEDLPAIQEGPNAGRQYWARLSVLWTFQTADPAFTAREWQRAMGTFANSIRTIAGKDPDFALGVLKTWQTNWSVYGELPKSGHVQEFMDGYLQATGVVKTMEYAKKASGSEAQRLYGKVSLDEVQKELSPDRPMIVYVRFESPTVPGKGTYGGFILEGGHNIRYVSLGETQAVEQAVVAWQRSILGGEEADPTGDPKKTGKSLFDLLVKPLVGDRKLPAAIIVPDGKIGDVAFAATVTPRGKFLTEETTLSYLGAMRDVVSTTNSGSDTPVGTPPVALYSPDLVPGNGAKTPPKSVDAFRQLDRLAVSATLSPDSLAKLRHPRFLHLLVHGEYAGAKAGDPKSVANAANIFVPSGAKSITYTAQQVANWDLRGTRLAVLASCKGGKAEILSGEGTGGLRRALFVAGAQQIIAPQRYVQKLNAKESSPGDRFFTALYQGIRQGKRPQESLRQAQRQMIDAKVPPFYWAGFLCEGAVK